MTTATGTFQVTAGGEDAYDELDGGVRLTHASGSQTFSGQLEGDGAVHWLMLYRPDKTAQFVGLQRITGWLDGRRGSFVASAQGKHDGTGSTIAFAIIPGSGTDDLAGIAGEGRHLVIEGGPAGTYDLEYRLDA